MKQKPTFNSFLYRLGGSAFFMITAILIAKQNFPAYQAHAAIAGGLCFLILLFFWDKKKKRKNKTRYLE